MEGEGFFIPDVLKPISWLIGCWESTEATGQYPTIKDFVFDHIVEFQLCGQQPVLAYTGSASHSEKRTPMQLQSGFLRARGSELSLMVAHNFGVVSLEEGQVSDGKIVLTSKSLARMTGAKDPEVTQIQRQFQQVSKNQIVQELSMATVTTPELTPHLKITYSRT